MDGMLLVFWLPPGTSGRDHNQFRRWCYGRKVSTWGGRYQYDLKGILDEIPSILLYTGVVIVQKKDSARLQRLLRQKGAKVVTRVVCLTRQDQVRLGLIADD